MNRKLLSYFRFILWAAVLLGGSSLCAQTLNKPVPAPNQTPPAGTTAWNRACASASFNDYWVNFTWSPPLVNSDNQFILELSDETGDFGDATELAREAGKNTTFDFYFQFSIPNTIRGEGYKFRVRSTSPAKTSPASDAFPMYYISVNSGLTIRQQGQSDFGDGSVQVCDGNSVTLEVYNLPNAGTYQYNWYRSGTPLSEKGHSITVSQDGMYNVEIDYGACSGSGNTLSNILDVTTGSSLGIEIDPPAKTDLCAGETMDLTANIAGAGLTYIWYKDGTPITPPTINDDTYTIDASTGGFEGSYQVEIFGIGLCVERSPAIVITSAGGFSVTRENAPQMVLLPGLSVDLRISTTASDPTIQWFKNGAAIAGATGTTLTLSDTADSGTYRADVSGSSGSCPATVSSSPTEVSIPASFEIIAGYASSYNSCENTSIVLEVRTINAVSEEGTKTDVTADMLSAFSFQWEKDGTFLPGETGTAISLASLTDNGGYRVQGSLESYSATSAQLPVQLRVNETLVISSTSLTACDSGTPITIDTETDLTGETFSWFRNGTDLGISTSELQVSEAGTYQLVIERGGCPLRSNTIEITPLNESLITLDSGDSLVIPEGSSRTVQASGAETYRWYGADNQEISTSATITISEEGDYLLLATVGNCEVSRTLKVEYLETFKVPNVISVNADGINDQWVLPNSYSNKADVRVTIYNERGEEVFNQTNYQNNWPESSRDFPRQNMVFYYKIRNADTVLKQGTITVIR